jgi:hypothetical protein
MRMRKDISIKQSETDTQHVNMIISERSNDPFCNKKPLRCFSLALSKSPDNNTSFIDGRDRTICCMPSLTCAGLVATWGFKQRQIRVALSATIKKNSLFCFCIAWALSESPPGATFVIDGDGRGCSILCEPTCFERGCDW